ncbi:hypothetical protein E1B28_010940 [Marasmius oreades]|uniref:Uncharacterized protein n=1 Tax=Marasmius oreades TaxID=181124 RepID=A0A9P7RU38_9AGAR|nr:uncharacterized protein E1B28_010940 [Marasmius oreades]KAG7089241.1 hypothetical protein E1B28_010940 [Marasmius oreades]
MYRVKSRKNRPASSIAADKEAGLPLNKDKKAELFARVGVMGPTLSILSDRLVHYLCHPLHPYTEALGLPDEALEESLQYVLDQYVNVVIPPPPSICLDTHDDRVTFASMTLGLEEHCFVSGMQEQDVRLYQDMVLEASVSKVF